MSRPKMRHAEDGRQPREAFVHLLLRRLMVQECHAGYLAVGAPQALHDLLQRVACAGSAGASFMVSSPRLTPSI